MADLPWCRIQAYLETPPGLKPLNWSGASCRKLLSKVSKVKEDLKPLFMVRRDLLELKLRFLLVAPGPLLGASSLKPDPDEHLRSKIAHQE